jgi:lysophospholipase L1-like esterase
MRKPRNQGLVCLLLLIPQLAGALQNTWIATWAASPEWADPDPRLPLLNIDDQTVRERVRISIGGARVRIRLSNEYGTAPLLIGSTTAAVPSGPGSVSPGSIHTVTFKGREAVTIPAGAAVVSDPVAFPVASGTEISISLYFPQRVTTPTLHEVALKRAMVSRRGDHTHADSMEAGAASKSSISLSAVLVPAQPDQRLVVAFGDSITDGYGSTVDADSNWPSDLIRRLAKTPQGSTVAVVNEGIGGNRLLRDGFGAGAGFGAGFGTSALARFDQDALSLPGVTHIVLLEGINDIGFPGAKLGERYLADPTDVLAVKDLIDAYLQLISRAHAHGVKLLGATISPFDGVDLPGYYSQSKEATRQAVNTWIRGSGSFDGVIDVDAVLRDPDHPSRLLPSLASKDHLHPNDAGYQAIADAIDLALFK